MPPKATTATMGTPNSGNPAKAPKKKPPTPFAVKPLGAFYVFFIANIIAALYAPIQDCDETFNYWEPTHFLSHGYGLQTWEYSPDYAIRSWLYIILHALIGNIRRLLPFSTKMGEFYFIRYILAFVCALSQTIMFRVVNNTLNPRIALFFMMAMVFSPGMFHASASFLPSSFAMYMTMLGMAQFMNWRGGLKTAQGIFCFAIGGILGWPFAMALSAPFLFEEVVFAFLSSKDALIDAVMRFIRGIVAALIVLLFEFAISGFFYKKLVVVPFNIVFYNMFSEPGKGPEIYGTEPWHFYIRNLLLNFNIWFILACLSLPLFTLQKIFSRQSQGSTITGLRSVIFMTPFYMWLAIFSFQPHKEERFMYPMYPALALNGAMSLHIVLAAFGQSDPKTLVGKIPAKVKLLIVSIFIFGSIDAGLARIFGIYTAYSAPLKIYDPLETIGAYGDSICFGKEWYRFPSSYHLPKNMRAKFVKSEFSGLLPGEFSEAKTGFGYWSGAYLIPSGMNDENIEDKGKYVRTPLPLILRSSTLTQHDQVDIRSCEFLVDTYYDNSTASVYEPHYVKDVENWDIVKCEKFLDAGKSHLLSRLIWVPDFSLIPEQYRRKWGAHCLLKKKASA
ncbi:Alg9-like mannosyltransferase [Drepanopeziza brunnea f. sp. 'multigermtubi' MB_m1]|uniref:Mannosyltransferase n=1 Tax=Marssonina brunnea f. sp. multigermtubi (strain MB_m1) TaxID=1072389 RepID=K1X126_MARBU|nr:Alg9-like mannosyltransferase [Drepanopeziza brunnea f. sp. 'multigermtubi' MB_m1]EKD18667.1 Alg9-like mannosyltransferase [Drepanopeziza brunnea f. sp. 'multigermtubi' MB_m1]